ncbi:MAG: nuclear transport factor 2 family protein [Actinomycetota bacterium]|nr:nuclear transport factor 2 family protein [Actinomycetota bacterium]
MPPLSRTVRTHTRRFRDSSSDVAYVLEIERFSAKLGGEGVRSGALRVTMVFRREDDTWKLVHRRADPLVEPQRFRH